MHLDVKKNGQLAEIIDDVCRTHPIRTRTFADAMYPQVIQYYNENGGNAGKDFAFDMYAHPVVSKRQFMGRV